MPKYVSRDFDGLQKQSDGIGETQLTTDSSTGYQTRSNYRSFAVSYLLLLLVNLGRVPLALSTWVGFRVGFRRRKTSKFT